VSLSVLMFVSLFEWCECVCDYLCLGVLFLIRNLIESCRAAPVPHWHSIQHNAHYHAPHVQGLITWEVLQRSTSEYPCACGHSRLASHLHPRGMSLYTTVRFMRSHFPAHMFTCTHAHKHIPHTHTHTQTPTPAQTRRHRHATAYVCVCTLDAASDSCKFCVFGGEAGTLPGMWAQPYQHRKKLCVS
jgi:hypothetical protein